MWILNQVRQANFRIGLLLCPVVSCYVLFKYTDAYYVCYVLCTYVISYGVILPNTVIACLLFQIEDYQGFQIACLTPDISRKEIRVFNACMKLCHKDTQREAERDPIEDSKLNLKSNVESNSKLKQGIPVATEAEIDAGFNYLMKIFGSICAYTLFLGLVDKMDFWFYSRHPFVLLVSLRQTIIFSNITGSKNMALKTKLELKEFQPCKEIEPTLFLPFLIINLWIVPLIF